MKVSVRMSATHAYYKDNAEYNKPQPQTLQSHVSKKALSEQR